MKCQRTACGREIQEDALYLSILRQKAATHGSAKAAQARKRQGLHLPERENMDNTGARGA